MRKMALRMCLSDARDRRETMEHALRCLARLIRALLGPTAVAEKKLAFGKSLDVLGVKCPAFAWGTNAVMHVRDRWTSSCPSVVTNAGQKRTRCADGCIPWSRLWRKDGLRRAKPVSWLDVCRGDRLACSGNVVATLQGKVRLCACLACAGNWGEQCCDPFMIRKQGATGRWRRSCSERSSGGWKC